MKSKKNQQLNINVKLLKYLRVCNFSIAMSVFMMFYLTIGAYAPLTKKGNIMVDGVLASCYAYTDHDVAHIALTPLRWFPGMVEWIFGADLGFQNYVKVVRGFGRVAVPESLL